MHLEEKKKIMTLIAEAYSRSYMPESLHHSRGFQEEAALILSDHFGPIEIKVAPPYESLSYNEFGMSRLPSLVGQSAITVEQNPWNNDALRMVIYLSPYINRFKADNPRELTLVPFLDFLSSIGTFLDYFPANVRLDKYLFSQLEMNLFSFPNGVERLVQSTDKQVVQLDLRDYNDGNSFPSIDTAIPPVWIALRHVRSLEDMLRYEQREVFSICKKVFEDFPYETPSSLAESETELCDYYKDYRKKYTANESRNLPNQIGPALYVSRKMEGTEILGVSRGVIKLSFTKDILGAVEKLPLDEEDKIELMIERAKSTRYSDEPFTYANLKNWVLTNPTGDTFLMSSSFID